MLTAEREKEPETGNDWVRLPTRFARPWPISSWLGSILSLVFAAMALAIEIASMKPTREMTMAAENRLPTMSHEKPGSPMDGKPCGTVPTTSPPPLSLRSWLAALAMRQLRPSPCMPDGTLPWA